MFGDLYRRDRVTYVQTTRHAISGEMVEGDPIEIKAYIEWNNKLRVTELGINPKQDAIMLVDSAVKIKQGDVVKKVNFSDGTELIQDFVVQTVTPCGGFSVSHKEVILGG